MTAVSPRIPPLVQLRVAGGFDFEEPSDVLVRVVSRLVPDLLGLRPWASVLLPLVLDRGPPGEPAALGAALPAVGAGAAERGAPAASVS